MVQALGSQQITGSPNSLARVGTLGAPSQHNIQCQPRFFFGLKGDVKNNVFFVEDNTVVYPCGHNVVVYNMADKSQRYIPGIEGSEGITAMALSPSRKFLAVCEQSQKAVCSVYNIGKFLEIVREKKSTQVYDLGAKKRRILVSQDCSDRAFVSCEFCPQNEKTIATVTSGSDAKLILWSWDKQKALSFADLTPKPHESISQVSFSSVEPTVVVCSGPDFFKYFKQEQNSLKLMHSSISRRDGEVHSTNYTCHTWLADGRLAMCNDLGQILLLESSGDYKGITAGDSRKEAFPINAIYPYSGASNANNENMPNPSGRGSQKSGFIVAGENGQIRVFFKSDQDTKRPYLRVEGEDLTPTAEHEKENPMLFQDIMYHKINTIVLSPKEDQVVFTTRSNQIVKVPINLERPNEEQKYEYLISSFHSKAIYGLDVCVKKPLVATCSSDRTVRIWSYVSDRHFQMDTCQQFQEEAYSVALHPSGFHLVVGFSDSVRLMNILDNALVPYKNLQIRECREIVFSHGGHLFACQNDKQIWVYKFYTAECPIQFQFEGHVQPVKRLSWLEDDTGFVSCGGDAILHMWKLYPEANPDDQGQPQHNPIWSFKHQKDQYSSVAVYRPQSEENKQQNQNAESPTCPLVYTTGSDRSIREVKNNGGVGKEQARYTEDITYSQILCGYQRRILIAGVSEAERPGSIQVFRYNPEEFIEKAIEVQAHSKQVERMRLNYDNSKLFSIGLDGVLACFTLKDNDPLSKQKLQSQPTVQLSEEILIEKQRQDQLVQAINILKEDIEQQKKNANQQLEQEVSSNEASIQKLLEQIEGEKSEYEGRNKGLQYEKEQVDLKGEEEQAYLKRLHEEELRLKKQEYEEKTLSDKERYEELKAQKDEQKYDFEKRISELYLQQDKAKKEMQQEHALQKQQKDLEYKEKQNQIETMEKDNVHKRKDIEDEAWERIDMLKDKNKDELALIIEEGMESKAKLTKVHGEKKSQEDEKRQLDLQKKAAEQRLKQLVQTTADLKAQIESQKAELNEREATIQDKDTRIIELKKKTQELEKFKFVLDYKIKELKRDIGPREVQIQQLHEQVAKMEGEVVHFRRVNANLRLIVNDLTMRQRGLEDENNYCGIKLDTQETEKKRFKDDVYETLQHIGDFKKLKKGVIRMYKAYVKEEGLKNAHNENEVNTQYTLQRRYMEAQLDYYRDSMRKDQQEHKNVNQRFMKDNVTLLQEINEQAQELHTLQQNIEILKRNEKGEDVQQHEFMQNSQVQKEMRMQDVQIEQLQMQIKQLEMDNEQLASRRPNAGMRLPPLEQEQMQSDAQLDEMDMEGGNAPPVYEGEPDSRQQPQYAEEDVNAPTEEQVPQEEPQVPQQVEMDDPQPDGLGETQQRDDPPTQLQSNPAEGEVPPEDQM